MSSILKKSGGAFKPKVPVARRRPAVDNATPIIDAQSSSRRSSTPAALITASNSTVADKDSSTSTTRRGSQASAPVAPASQSRQTATAQPTAASNPKPNAQALEPAQQGRILLDDTSSVQANSSDSHGAQVAVPLPTPPSSDPRRKSSTNQATRPGFPDAPQNSSLHQEEIIPTIEQSETAEQSSAGAHLVDQPRQANLRGRKRKSPDGRAFTTPIAEDQDQVLPTSKRRATETKIAGTEEAIQPKSGNDGSKRSRSTRSTKKDSVDPSSTDLVGRVSTDLTELEPGKPRKRPVKKRSVTPEDAEERTIDHKETKMGELTKDMRIGTKFSRHDELRQRISQKRSRDRLLKLGRIAEAEAKLNAANLAAAAQSELGDDDNDDKDQDEDEEATSAAPADSPAPSPLLPSTNKNNSAAGPRLQLINGQIAIDPNSLTYDRHAAADLLNADVETIEENDWTSATNNATYMKPTKKGPNHWSDEDTIEFYKHLRMFGTDLGTITTMFAGRKDRRQVKLKFNREERLNPAAINRAIIGVKKVSMDMDVVRHYTGVEYEESQAILDELARHKEEQEATHRALEEEEREEARRKKEELFKGRNKGRRKRERRGRGGGGGGIGGGLGPGSDVGEDEEAEIQQEEEVEETQNDEGLEEEHGEEGEEGENADADAGDDVVPDAAMDDE